MTRWRMVIVTSAVLLWATFGLVGPPSRRTAECDPGCRRVTVYVVPRPKGSASSSALLWAAFGLVGSHRAGRPNAIPAAAA